jgi:hypothetical protein
MQRFVGRAYVDPQGLMTLTKAQVGRRTCTRFRCCTTLLSRVKLTIEGQEEVRVEWERASKLSGASMVVDGLDVRRIKQVRHLMARP